MADYAAAHFGAEAAKRIGWIAEADFGNSLNRLLFPFWQQRAVDFAVAAARAAGRYLDS